MSIQHATIDLDLVDETPTDGPLYWRAAFSAPRFDLAVGVGLTIPAAVRDLMDKTVEETLAGVQELVEAGQL